MKPLKYYVINEAAVTGKPLSVADIKREFAGFLGKVLGKSYTVHEETGEITWEIQGVDLAKKKVLLPEPSGWTDADAFRDRLLSSAKRGAKVTFSVSQS